MASSATGSNRWLYGPARDLLFGCGLLYVAFFALSTVAGGAIRLSQPTVLLPLLIVLSSTPHYGATLIRVYEQRRDRQAYAYYAGWITMALLLLFVTGVYDDLVASCMFTLYLTWSPWHYTGQNFGVGVMMLRRAGVEIAPDTRRWVHATFVLSYALTFVAMHDGSGAVTDSMVGYAGEGVRFLSLGIPNALCTAAISLLGVAHLGCTVGAAVRLLRVATARDLVPIGALWLTQAVWFAIPLSIRGLGLTTPVEPLSSELRSHYFLWIAVGHAVQYLWVTSYFARASSGERGLGVWYGKALLAGNAAWAVPVLLFAPDGIGRLSYDGGLALTVAAFVNLHHFVLDGAIWKLRSKRVADVLIRTTADGLDADAAGSGARGALGRKLVWSATALMMMLSAAEFWERLIHRPSAAARGAWDTVSASLDRTAWIGRDNAAMRVRLGDAYARSGDHAAAGDQYLRSIALRSNSQALDGIGQLLLSERRFDEALRYFEAALEESPDSPGIMAHAAKALIEKGEIERGRAMLARARSLEEDAADSGTDGDETPRASLDRRATD